MTTSAQFRISVNSIRTTRCSATQYFCQVFDANQGRVILYLSVPAVHDVVPHHIPRDHSSLLRKIVLARLTAADRRFSCGPLYRKSLKAITISIFQRSSWQAAGLNFDLHTLHRHIPTLSLCPLSFASFGFDILATQMTVTCCSLSLRATRMEYTMKPRDWLVRL
jgi:hypothetical protein